VLRLRHYGWFRRARRPNRLPLPHHRKARRWGNLAIEYGGHALRWRQIAAPARPQALAPTGKARVPISIKKRKWTPPANHPWHEPGRPAAQKRAAKMAARSSRPSLACPALRPKRFALRATQGYAPGLIRTKQNTKKGDISNEVRKGTSLMSFDSFDQVSLTEPRSQPKMAALWRNLTP
jgi:hypothetical protein